MSLHCYATRECLKVGEYILVLVLGFSAPEFMPRKKIEQILIDLFNITRVGLKRVFFIIV